MPKKKTTEAVAYIRRSSAKEDNGSFDRQINAIEGYCSSAGVKIVEDGFYRDGNVSGTKNLEDRDGLLALFNRCEEDGIRTVVIADASRLARELICQMVLIERFRKAGLVVLDATGLEVTDIDCPQKKLIVQIIGSLQEWDRSQTIAKMNAGRDRARAKGLKAEGAHPFGHTASEKRTLKRIKQLRANHGNTDRRPKKWVTIAAMLTEEGHRNRAGGEFTSAYVSKLAKANAIK